MGLKLDKDPLVVQQNNSTTKTVKPYILYDSRTPTNNFKFKNCSFGATSAKVIKESMCCIVATELHLTVQVRGYLIMTVLKML